MVAGSLDRKPSGTTGIISDELSRIELDPLGRLASGRWAVVAA